MILEEWEIISIKEVEIMKLFFIPLFLSLFNTGVSNTFLTGEYGCNEGLIKFDCDFDNTTKQMEVLVNVLGKKYSCDNISYMYNTTTSNIIVNEKIIDKCFNNEVSDLSLKYSESDNTINLSLDVENRNNHCTLKSKSKSHL